MPDPIQKIVEFELIWVVPLEKGRVGAYERHPAHPSGEAWVAWDASKMDETPAPVLVARTPFIAGRLGRFIRQVVDPTLKEEKVLVDVNAEEE